MANLNHKGWTAKDDAVLREQYYSVPADKLARQLGRTQGAIWSRVHYLRSKNQISAPNPAAPQVHRKSGRNGGRKPGEYIVLHGKGEVTKLKSRAALEEYLHLQPFTSKPLVAKVMPVKFKVVLG